MADRAKQDRAFVVRPRIILLMSAPLRLAHSSLPGLPPHTPWAPGGHRRQMAGEGSPEGHILWGPLQVNGPPTDGLIDGKTSRGAGITFSTVKFPTESRGQSIRLPARPRPICAVRPLVIRHEMVKGFLSYFEEFSSSLLREQTSYVKVRNISLSFPVTRTPASARDTRAAQFPFTKLRAHGKPNIEGPDEAA